MGQKYKQKNLFSFFLKLIRTIYNKKRASKKHMIYIKVCYLLFQLILINFFIREYNLNNLFTFKTYLKLFNQWSICIIIFFDILFVPFFFQILQKSAIFVVFFVVILIIWTHV